MDNLLAGKADPPCFKQDQPALSVVQRRCRADEWPFIKPFRHLNIHSDRDRNPIHFPPERLFTSARNRYSHPGIIIHFDRNPQFVTAYDQHAIRAFEANALDYLLKPFSDERFEAAFARAKARYDERNMQEFGHSVLRMLATRPQAGHYLDRLVVKGGGTTRFILVADTEWIEAAGVYANLHIADNELLYRSALNELADRLDPMHFVRVHRSAIVNIDSILELQPISHGEFELLLRYGHRLRVSRTYRTQLEKRLGQAL